MSKIDRVLRSNLKLRHLQLLVALDQFRHLGRAAEFLAVTQPAVSKTLAEVERMLGMALFERSTRGTEPTAAGVSMVRFARSVLAGFERTRDEMAAEASGARGRTSVGAMVVATPVLLARAVERLKRVRTRPR
jgi:DNA-binding transcriptional LysR family regulator